MNLRKIIRESLEELLREARKRKNKKKAKPYINKVSIGNPSASIFYMDALDSGVEESKDSKGELLDEMLANKVVPKTFDHLKWKLNQEQKHFLQDFIDLHPDTVKDSDYKLVSRKTGVPISSLKSIQNTYGSWNVKKKSIVQPKDLADNGRFSANSKQPLTAKDYEIPQKNREDVVNFKKISKEESDSLRYPKKSLRQKKYESDLGISIKGAVKKSDTIKESNYDDWLVYYLLGELKPKACKINKIKKWIEIDFEPTEDYYDFHKSMLNSNKKSKFWISAESLVNQFNEVFGAYYIIEDQFDLVKSKSNCIRLVIKEFAVKDKMIWSADSQSYIPWEYASEHSKKEYLNNKAWNLAKPVADVDFNDLLDKYLSFHNSMFKDI